MGGYLDFVSDSISGVRGDILQSTSIQVCICSVSGVYLRSLVAVIVVCARKETLIRCNPVRLRMIERTELAFKPKDPCRPCRRLLGEGKRDSDTPDRGLTSAVRAGE